MLRVSKFKVESEFMFLGQKIGLLKDDAVIDNLTKFFFFSWPGIEVTNQKFLKESNFNITNGQNYEMYQITF
jgi:hypothetical protein